MTANDYSIEKYVSEYLKPLEEKGIITDLRIIPCRCRIMFRLNEPSRENSMKVIIETETDEDHITFFKSDVSAEETFRSPERRFIYQRLMNANKTLNDELNRKSVNTDLYITKYLKPLEEKGLIKNLKEDILSIKQEMESELTPYKMKLQEIQNEITRISQPYKKRIKQKEQEYLDKFLVDCNGNSVHTGDILTNNVTGESFKVVNRFQQKVIHYLGNPRVVVVKLNKKGEPGKKEFSIFTCELKECFSIKK